MELATEKDTQYQNLHELSLEDILENIKKEDKGIIKNNNTPFAGLKL